MTSIWTVAAQCAAGLSDLGLRTATPSPEVTLPSPSDAPPVEAALVSSPVDPGDLLATIQQRGLLRVGLRVWADATFGPPAFRGPAGGALTGFEVDLARELANSLQVELELVEVDPSTLRNGHWRGQWDLALATLAITDDAQQTLTFSHPYVYLPVGLLVRADDADRRDLKSTQGLPVAVPAETTIQALLQGEPITVQGVLLVTDVPSNLVIVAYGNDAAAIRDLAAAQPGAPAAVVHFAPILESALEFELPVRLVEPALFWAPIGIGYDRSGPTSVQLTEAVNTALARMREDGRLADLSLRWFRQDFSIIP